MEVEGGREPQAQPGATVGAVRVCFLGRLQLRRVASRRQAPERSTGCRSLQGLPVGPSLAPEPASLFCPAPLGVSLLPQSSKLNPQTIPARSRPGPVSSRKWVLEGPEDRGNSCTHSLRGPQGGEGFVV